jgi:hypothetical protein
MADDQKRLAKRLIVEIIRQSGGVLDNKTNLFEAFYHAHLHFFATQPGLLSHWPMVRLSNGPGIDDADLLLGELIEERQLRIAQVQTDEFQGFRFELTGAPDSSLPAEAMEAISFGVEQARASQRGAQPRTEGLHSRSWKAAQNGDRLNIYVDPIPEAEFNADMARLGTMADGMPTAHQG